MRLLYESGPLDPDSCQMVLVFDPPCRVPNRLPQGLLMGGDLSLELHTQPLGCVHAWGGVWHMLVIHG